MSTLKDKNILICITGSIAAYKSCEIIRLLRKEGAKTQVVLSKAAQQFIGVATLAALSNNSVITSLFPDKPKGGLQHIDFAFDIDLIVVAPATANILCKAGNGIADDLVSTTLSVCEQTQIFAPAMNHRMWQNKATIEAVKKLRKNNKIILNPEEGKLASLHTGEGRLPSNDTIMNEIRKAFDQPLYLENKNVLVTAGPTRESIDPVRFLSNRSSGKMGYALAKVARDFGAQVDLVSGPVNLTAISQINIHKVETANEMNINIQNLLKIKKYDYIFMAAAVADYYKEDIPSKKIKKDGKKLDLHLVKSPDILKNISSQSNAQIIGFALETDDGENQALLKLKNKNLDYIVLNYANEENAGFESNTNHVIIFSKDGSKKELLLDRKDRIAAKLINYIIKNK